MRINYDADPDKVYIYDVPVFDEHFKKDDISFSADDIKRLIENTNYKIKDTHDLVPLIPGHCVTDDSVPEYECPCMGYAENFRLGQIGELDPRAAVIADLCIPKESWEKVKGMPRRSPELVVPDGDKDQAFVDRIALLGKTSPARHLGYMHYASDEPRYTYEFKDEDTTMTRKKYSNNDLLLPEHRQHYAKEDRRSDRQKEMEGAKQEGDAEIKKLIAQVQEEEGVPVVQPKKKGILGKVKDKVFGKKREPQAPQQMKDNSTPEVVAAREEKRKEDTEARQSAGKPGLSSFGPYHEAHVNDYHRHKNEERLAGKTLPKFNEQPENRKTTDEPLLAEATKEFPHESIQEDSFDALKHRSMNRDLKIGEAQPQKLPEKRQRSFLEPSEDRPLLKNKKAPSTNEPAAPSKNWKEDLGKSVGEHEADLKMTIDAQNKERDVQRASLGLEKIVEGPGQEHKPERGGFVGSVSHNKSAEQKLAESKDTRRAAVRTGTEPRRSNGERVSSKEDLLKHTPEDYASHAPTADIGKRDPKLTRDLSEHGFNDKPEHMEAAKKQVGPKELPPLKQTEPSLEAVERAYGPDKPKQKRVFGPQEAQVNELRPREELDPHNLAEHEDLHYENDEPRVEYAEEADEPYVVDKEGKVLETPEEREKKKYPRGWESVGYDDEAHEYSNRKCYELLNPEHRKMYAKSTYDVKPVEETPDDYTPEDLDWIKTLPQANERNGQLAEKYDKPRTEEEVRNRFEKGFKKGVPLSPRMSGKEIYQKELEEHQAKMDEVKAQKKFDKDYGRQPSPFDADRKIESHRAKHGHDEYYTPLGVDPLKYVPGAEDEPIRPKGEAPKKIKGDPGAVKHPGVMDTLRNAGNAVLNSRPVRALEKGVNKLLAHPAVGVLDKAEHGNLPENPLNARNVVKPRTPKSTKSPSDKPPSTRAKYSLLESEQREKYDRYMYSRTHDALTKEHAKNKTLGIMDNDVNDQGIDLETGRSGHADKRIALNKRVDEQNKRIMEASAQRKKSRKDTDPDMDLGTKPDLNLEFSKHEQDDKEHFKNQTLGIGINDSPNDGGWDLETGRTAYPYPDRNVAKTEPHHNIIDPKTINQYHDDVDKQPKHLVDPDDNFDEENIDDIVGRQEYANDGELESRMPEREEFARKEEDKRMPPDFTNEDKSVHPLASPQHENNMRDLLGEPKSAEGQARMKKMNGTAFDNWHEFHADLFRTQPHILEQLLAGDDTVQYEADAEPTTEFEKGQMGQKIKEEKLKEELDELQGTPPGRENMPPKPRMEYANNDMGIMDKKPNDQGVSLEQQDNVLHGVKMRPDQVQLWKSQLTHKGNVRNAQKADNNYQEYPYKTTEQNLEDAKEFFGKKHGAEAQEPDVNLEYAEDTSVPYEREEYSQKQGNFRKAEGDDDQHVRDWQGQMSSEEIAQRRNALQKQRRLEASGGVVNPRGGQSKRVKPPAEGDHDQHVREWEQTLPKEERQARFHKESIQDLTEKRRNEGYKAPYESVEEQRGLPKLAESQSVAKRLPPLDDEEYGEYLKHRKKYSREEVKRDTNPNDVYARTLDKYKYYPNEGR